MLRLLLVGLLWTGPVAAETVTLFAAASLGSALEDLGANSPLEGIRLRLALSGSSTAAKQIEAGAPADLFVSANGAWMDYLEGRGLIEEGTRRDLCGNSLVLVAPRGEDIEVEMRPGFDFAAAFNGRLAIGDPTHVPAGIYARHALERLGWWEGIKSRLAPAKDVRAALALVERGACPVGVVYATDAPVSAEVEVLAAVPDSLYPAVVYPMAVVRGKRTAAVVRVAEYLASNEAAVVLKRHHFKPLATASVE